MNGSTDCHDWAGQPYQGSVEFRIIYEFSQVSYVKIISLPVTWAGFCQQRVKFSEHKLYFSIQILSAIANWGNKV
jgi:hypothetical protein